MIEKFQQGGQLDQIFNAINSQPEQALQLLVQSGAKPEDIVKIVQAGVLQGKIKPEVGQAILQAMLGLKVAARHGIKLNYIKSLKNKCAEDEEVVYYKKGGSVKCGCKKKEEGGEVKKDCGGSKMKKFKMAKGGQLPYINPNDTVHVNGRAYVLTNMNGTPVNKKLKFPKYEGKVEKEDRAKALKGDKDAKRRQAKAEEITAPKCGGKVKKHQEGSIITKFKMHRYGGSLNGIPFYLEGTPNLGIRIKEEVERINLDNKNTAKGLFKGIFSGLVMPTMLNIGRMVSSAYSGWIDPESPYITGTVPTSGVPTKAKNAWEALQMVKAMKALKTAKTAEIAKARMIAGQKSAATRRANGTARGGTPGLKKLEQVPDIPNYLEIYDGYKMTKASRLNMNNVLDKLPDSEREMVLKVIVSNPDHYLNTIGNITPGRAGSMISTIRRRLPGVEYTPLRVKSLDLTRPNMGTGIFLKFDDATSKTAGFKRTTDKY